MRMSLSSSSRLYVSAVLCLVPVLSGPSCSPPRDPTSESMHTHGSTIANDDVEGMLELLLKEQEGRWDALESLLQKITRVLEDLSDEGGDLAIRDSKPDELDRDEWALLLRQAEVRHLTELVALNKQHAVRELTTAEHFLSFSQRESEINRYSERAASLKDGLMSLDNVRSFADLEEWKIKYDVQSE